MNAVILKPPADTRAPASRCARCGRRRPVYARRICKPCYSTAARNGTLSEYELPPGSARRTADRLEDFSHLREHGETIETAAARLHITLDTARKYERQRKQDQPGGQPPGTAPIGETPVPGPRHPGAAVGMHVTAGRVPAACSRQVTAR